MKTKTIFVCQNCGAQAPRWVGKCPSCESWNSYVEENTATVESSERMGGVVLKESPILLSEVTYDDKKRYETNILELDRWSRRGFRFGTRRR